MKKSSALEVIEAVGQTIAKMEVEAKAAKDTKELKKRAQRVNDGVEALRLGIENGLAFAASLLLIDVPIIDKALADEDIAEKIVGDWAKMCAHDLMVEALDDLAGYVEEGEKHE